MLRSIGSRETSGKIRRISPLQHKRKRCGVTHFTELHRTLHKNFPIRRSVSGVNGLPELGVSVLHGKNTSLRQAPDLAIMGKNIRKGAHLCFSIFLPSPRYPSLISRAAMGRPWSANLKMAKARSCSSPFPWAAPSAPMSTRAASR